MNLKQRAREYFASHTTVNEFFFTSDGLAFFNNPDAEAHAPSLEDKKIEKITRAEAEDMQPATSDQETEQTNPDVAAAAKKTTKATATDKKVK